MKLSMSDILIIITEANWRAFDAIDYDSFSGVAAENNPMIAEDEDLGMIYIISGNALSIIWPSGTEHVYQLEVTGFDVLPSPEDLEV